MLVLELEGLRLPGNLATGGSESWNTLQLERRAVSNVSLLQLNHQAFWCLIDVNKQKSMKLLVATIFCALAALFSLIMSYLNNETTLTYSGDGMGLPKLYDKLISSPQITSLDITMHTAGCCVNGAPWSFNFRPGDRFPSLKELSLDAYDLDDAMIWRWQNIQWRDSIQYQVQEYLGMVLPWLAPMETLRPPQGIPSDPTYFNIASDTA